MDKDEVAKILKPAFPGDLIEVDGENSYFTVSIVSDKFENLTKFQRHQFVYSCLTYQISSGAIYALDFHSNSVAYNNSSRISPC